MSSVNITVDDADHVRTMLGVQDQFLRRVRERFDVSIVARGGELSVEGDEAGVRMAQDALQQMLAAVQERGGLSEAEVEQAIASVAGAAAPDAATIDLFEKARKVQPRTPGQAKFVRALQEKDLVFCTGPAGCGKTYLSVAMAINQLRQEQVRRIVLVRPAVEAGEKLGFLPGDMLAKVNPFLRPLLDALNDMLSFDQVRRYMESDVIEILPLAFMRGRTLNETFIILDEAQNTTATQMKMFLTRMGEGSKIVVTGDATQVDLATDVRSGLIDAIDRLGKIKGVGIIELTGADIVRHRLVREIVAAYESDKSPKHSNAGRRKPESRRRPRTRGSS